ncbi:hypothetical protein [Sedimenticola selenatireducens]|uniref:Uncharacterized protein n=1 Tax=Sedimenticola selenatireducens TaxID=191960 RepID=A0A557SHP6_9GAMM|nr:hypothetical protein [Sedimenticola selenatireducens]TVO76939.1 hypothetical protein FHP88_05815 [Sedimenticola selenatireducens]TVT64382.1 MAG: hypothetical protein FHK78_09060 [Sedimenticola selenatireducens]
MNRSVFLCALSLTLSGCFHQTRPYSPPPPMPDGAWLGPDKTYTPTPVDQLLLPGFGINQEVDVLGSGALPITINREIVNSGQATLSAGYPVTETVELMVFVRVAGSAGWTPGPAATHTLFTCAQPGPELLPGESADISFTFPGPLCTPNPVVAMLPLGPLSCGMYKETLIIDDGNTVAEGATGELNNEAEHFFYVPSSAPQLNMNVVLNPVPDPNISIVPVRRVVIPAFNYPPPAAGMLTTTSHQVTLSTNPAGGGYSVHGRSLVKGSPDFAPDVGNLVPPIVPPMLVVAPGTLLPTVINYNISFDPTYLGPNISGSGAYYAEGFDSKITAISTDGCMIRQKTLKATVLHEERP